MEHPPEQVQREKAGRVRPHSAVEARAQGPGVNRRAQAAEAMKPWGTHAPRSRHEQEWAEPRTNPRVLGTPFSECHVATVSREGVHGISWADYMRAHVHTCVRAGICMGPQVDLVCTRRCAFPR